MKTKQQPTSFGYSELNRLASIVDRQTAQQKTRQVQTLFTVQEFGGMQ
jgi:hypothetical protein